MYPLICVGFEGLTLVASTKNSVVLGYSAILAFSVHPTVLDVAIAYISLGFVKLRDGKLAVRIFRTVHAASREEAGQLRDGNGE
jgi:hypothetical protein